MQLTLLRNTLILSKSCFYNLLGGSGAVLSVGPVNFLLLRWELPKICPWGVAGGRGVLLVVVGCLSSLAGGNRVSSLLCVSAFSPNPLEDPFPCLGQFFISHALISTLLNTWGNPLQISGVLCAALSALPFYPVNSSCFDPPRLSVLSQLRISPGSASFTLSHAVAWKSSQGCKPRQL